jgi:hypothetical protein
MVKCREGEKEVGEMIAINFVNRFKKRMNIGSKKGK